MVPDEPVDPVGADDPVVAVVSVGAGGSGRVGGSGRIGRCCRLAGHRGIGGLRGRRFFVRDSVGDDHVHRQAGDSSTGMVACLAVARSAASLISPPGSGSQTAHCARAGMPVMSWVSPAVSGRCRLAAITGSAAGSPAATSGVTRHSYWKPYGPADRPTVHRSTALVMLEPAIDQGHTGLDRLGGRKLHDGPFRGRSRCARRSSRRSRSARGPSAPVARPSGTAARCCPRGEQISGREGHEGAEGGRCRVVVGGPVAAAHADGWAVRSSVQTGGAPWSTTRPTRRSRPRHDRPEQGRAPVPTRCRAHRRTG